MAWPSIEPTSSHLTYLILSAFLICYALFSELIRNRLHLSEPPLATLAGIACGPRGLDAINPISWGWEDNITQELTRLIVGIQVFAVGVELPGSYVKRHWRDILLLLGPNMIFGWLVSAGIVYLILNTSASTAFIIAACLTPTDPVLSASVLGEARFSSRVPKRLRNLLAAESGCNDGTSFPFLYAGLLAVISATNGEAVQSWFLEVIVWQCTFGIFCGLIIGTVGNRVLRFSESRGYIQDATLLVFYFLLAVLSVGVGSTLGVDDFLVAFSAGTAFCWDGWFAKRTRNMKLPSILDLMLNSSMFVYFGAIIPWEKFSGSLNPGRMILGVLLILLLRRIPALLALKWALGDIRTYGEALFAGHFGPMGVGALFLAIEARARLETGTSDPMPHPPVESPYKDAIDAVWPVICFVVLSSIMVHGLSAAVMSVVIHFMHDPKERAPLIGSEDGRLYGMAHEDGASTDGDDPDEEDE